MTHSYNALHKIAQVFGSLRVMERHCKNSNKICIQLLLLVYSWWVFSFFLFFVRSRITFVDIYSTPPVLKYANNDLKGVVTRNYVRLHFE